MHRLLLLALVVSACSAGSLIEASADETGAVAVPAAEELVDERPTLEPIVLPLSLYVVHEAGAESDPTLSSARTEDEVEAIAESIQEIWSPAAIVFDPIVVQTIDVPSAAIEALVSLDSQPFFQGAGRTFEVPDAGAINGFYVPFLGGVNGFAPSNSRAFFVTDEPSVHDQRVSSHEIGHLLGLHHDLDDSDRLMFSGTNGTELTPTETTVSRYSAEGILNGIR